MSIQELQVTNNGVFWSKEEEEQRRSERKWGLNPRKTPLKPPFSWPCAPPRRGVWACRSCAHMQPYGPHLDPSSDLRQNNHFSNTWNYQNAPETKTRSNYQNTPETQNAPETLNRFPTPSDGYQTFPYGLCLPKVEIQLWHRQTIIEHFSKAYDLPKVEI